MPQHCRLTATLEAVVERRRGEGLLRKLTVRQPGQVDFCSNDYLGLAASKDLAAEVDKEFAEYRRHAAKESLLEQGLGSTGSRLLTGNSAYHESTEAMLAEFHNGQAALLFNSGFDLNFSFFAYVPSPGDVVVFDELVHASVREGIRAGRAASRAFKHNNVASLRATLSAVAAERDLAEQEGKRRGNIIVAVESVYSMDGDCAPLVEICDAADEVHAAVMVDEAHGTGCFGPSGRGLAAELGVEHRTFCRAHTFGKAMGCHGAVAVGPRVLYDYLINYARPLIYSTSMSYHAVANVRCAYAILRRTAAERQAHLRQLIQVFQERLARGVPPERAVCSPSPIQAIIIPGNAQVMAAAQHLQQRGMHVLPIRSPTVPKGTERLRIILHAHNTEAEVHRLMDEVEHLLREGGRSQAAMLAAPASSL